LVIETSLYYDARPDKQKKRKCDMDNEESTSKFGGGKGAFHAWSFHLQGERLRYPVDRLSGLSEHHDKESIPSSDRSVT
jgi:hypothetical protein